MFVQFNFSLTILCTKAVSSYGVTYAQLHLAP